MQGQCSSVPLLLQTINDKVQTVSIVALNTLEALGCGDDSVICITNKRFNWVKVLGDKDTEQDTSKNKKHTIYR